MFLPPNIVRIAIAKKVIFLKSKCRDQLSKGRKENDMQRVLNEIDFALLIIMSVAYSYHILYIFVGWYNRKKENTHTPVQPHRFAALICARNEGSVITELINSLKKQNYPAELLDVYVLADNCTDDTAEKAAAAGAQVYWRFNREQVGKGYALDYLLQRIDKEKGYHHYDGFFVFDADNIVDSNFVSEMNKTYSKGYQVITSYRNSKNFAANWITYGYSVWFMFEARFINSPRMILGNGCAVSGTGFFVSSKVVSQNKGWPFHLLTEDIQFSVNCAITGCKIGYCNNAIVYDEQPVSFSQSWTQRMRWAKGFYQIDSKYLGKLSHGALTSRDNRMTCYDILMTVAPSRLLSIFVAGFNVIVLLTCLTMPVHTVRLVVAQSVSFIGMTFVMGYIGTVIIGLITVISEWERIHTVPWRKLVFLPLFPVFMATYIPISLAALIKKVDWKPIRHYASSQMDATLASSRNSAGN